MPTIIESNASAAIARVSETDFLASDVKLLTCDYPSGNEVCGNVWEWTTDWFVANHAPADPDKPSCCAVTDPRGPAREASLDPLQPQVNIPRRVVKGGSFLCAPNYCRRYRPAARHAQMVESGMSHIGFRCIRRRTT